MSALTRLVTEEKDNPKLRGSCYVAVGKLGLKIPALVNKVVYSYLLVYFGFIIALKFFLQGLYNGFTKVFLLIRLLLRSRRQIEKKFLSACRLQTSNPDLPMVYKFVSRARHP